MQKPSEDTIERLKALVGPKGWIESQAGKAAFLNDERRLYEGQARLVLRPASAQEVSQIVSVCAGSGIALVPQGGNTGYVGGSVPDESGAQILLSLGRMNRVREVDPVNFSMTVEAGCVLADIQAAAAAQDRLFPLSLAAEGSCQIGGNLSTNAGGITVVRYGNARDLVLGLEVVLPDGQIWDGLRGLRKDNTGYDLKQLFLGAEGTLGIITAAVLRLYPLPKASCTAFIALPTAQAATELLARLREVCGEAVTSFEYIHRVCLDLVLEGVEGVSDPFEDKHQHYVLLELTSSRPDDDLAAVLESVLAEAFERGGVANAVVASSEAQAASLWRLRETIPEAQKHGGACIKHDISIPVSKVPSFLERATALCEDMIAEVRVSPFGHLGDGNIHFNLMQPRNRDSEAFLAHYKDVTEAVHDLAAGMGGSFSAEHGIGRLKMAELERYRGGVELDLMRKVKQALDPQGLMNPGKLL